MYNPYSQNPNYTNGINWCQGDAGAKSFPVQPGTTVAIFDSEESCVYIKTVDIMGRPLPLKILDYVERSNEPKVIEDKNYVEKETFEEAIERIDETVDRFDETVDDLNDKIDKILKTLAKEEKKNAK